jgi:long-chain acyl-CoA synthetase
MSIHWPIIRRCLRSPLRVAIVDDQRKLRTIELLVGAMHVAGQLRETSKSSTVGVLLPTSGAFPIAALAGWIAARTVVPLNYLLKPAELQYVVDDCGCDTILTAKPMLDFLGEPPRGARLVRLEELDFHSMPDVQWPARASADDLAVLLYTSGTSGKPKGVMLTHGNISANIRQIDRWVDFSSRDTLLGVLPQFHSFGLTVLTLLPLTIGCRVVYTARFVPGKLVRLLREHRPTVMIAIPSMYNALLHAKNAGPEDFASLRYTVSGGEPLPQSVLEGFRERYGVTINEGYGLTETAPVTNWCRPEEFRPRSVGRALPWIDQKIVDVESGRDLPPGHDGEVRMRGPNIMKGYYNLPAETAAAFDEKGYFRTGDIGRLDEDGHLYITGRLKEMLIVGGENVFPREIEEVLNRHPTVKDSGVVGVMDPIRGELPLAFVEMKEDPPGSGKTAPFDERALLAWCRERLAGYKVPREIRCVPALPRNATGKVLRRELKALATQSAGAEARIAAS